ncbi:hypothetical protein RRG08_061056 [Elysia crispata]|uniref:Uncharacterized protein n=1 Tax=Elysia crispata TaxID=231223 RepID=A0AAE1AVD3_9GAST|nr:hypothetical protein RRG08_061056 [Elysia crispata]
MLRSRSKTPATDHLHHFSRLLYLADKVLTDVWPIWQNSHCSCDNPIESLPAQDPSLAALQDIRRQVFPNSYRAERYRDIRIGSKIKYMQL